MPGGANSLNLHGQGFLSADIKNYESQKYSNEKLMFLIMNH